MREPTLTAGCRRWGSLLMHLLLLTAAGSAAATQELLPGTQGFITSPGGAVGETVADNRVVHLLYGQALRVEEIAPNRVIVRHRGLQVFIKPDDISTAEAALESLTAGLHPTDAAREPSLQASLLYSLNRLGEASSRAKNALQLNPQDARALHIQALIAGRKDDLVTLTKIATELQNLKPNDVTAYQVQFALESHKKRWRKALHLSQEGTHLFPSNSQLWSHRAMAHAQLDEHEEANQCLKQAIAHSPSNPNTYRDHGILALCQNRKGRGLELLEKAARYHDNRHETYRHLLEQRNEHQDLAIIQQYLLQAANCPDCPAQQKRRIAWLLATCHLPQLRSGLAALEISNELVRGGQIEPEMNALCLKTQAAALAELGRFQNAIHSLDLINPDSRDAQHAQMLDAIGHRQPYRDFAAFSGIYCGDLP